MNKFWNWIRDAAGGRVLRLEGPIDSEIWWGDEITPQDFREELESDTGDITLWINSPGGNVFAAAEIYTMLKEYEGAVTVRIASLAASAASVVAMAGDKIQMSPTAMIMIHDPMTFAMGNAKDMEKTIDILNTVKESIVNAYVLKTGLDHDKISELMESETWLDAKEALELGFCDEILYENKDEEAEDVVPEKEVTNRVINLFSTRMMNAAILNRLNVKVEDKKEVEPAKPEIGMDGKTKDGAMPYEILRNQLDFLK